MGWSYREFGTMRGSAVCNAEYSLCDGMQEDPTNDPAPFIQYVERTNIEQTFGRWVSQARPITDDITDRLRNQDYHSMLVSGKEA